MEKEIGALSMVGTFSKAPRAYGFEDDLTVVRGKRAEIYLDTGEKLLDWVCGLGAVILGYSNKEYEKHVIRQVKYGAGFSLPYYLEQLVAEELVEVLGSHVPGWSPEGISVRFAKTGTDATTMAVKLARAVTGQDTLLHSGYSGWADVFTGVTPPALGVPDGYRQHTKTFKYNDKDSVVRANPYDVAAAIMLEQGVEDPEDCWYDFLRKEANDSGALLILDEVVTGLRFGLGGAAELFGVEPDIIVLGKALGNGMPISAVVGRKEYLEWFARTDPVFASSTHWGEAVSLAAADAVLNIWGQREINHIWKIGESLMDGLANAGWSLVGHPPRSLLTFESELERAFFIQGMRARGILMNRPNFVNLAHTQKDVIRTVAAAGEIRSEWQAADKDKLAVELADKMPHILFKNR